MRDWWRENEALLSKFDILVAVVVKAGHATSFEKSYNLVWFDFFKWDFVE